MARLVALLTGIALCGAPLPVLAAPPAETEAADSEAAGTDPKAADPKAADPTAADPAAADPAEDAEDPLAEPAPEFEKPAPAPAHETPAPAPAKPKKEPKVDPLGLGLAVGGYALLVVSIGLFAGMGVQMGKGKDANAAIQSTTTPDTEEMRINAFADGRDANTAARNFGIAAGVIFVVGVALVGTGHGLMAKKKREKQRASLTPNFGPHGAGITWRVAF